MHKYIVLFTLLTFYCVPVSAGLQEVLNIAKCIADIQQELPNSCVYIMNSEGEERGENVFPPNECCVLEKMCSDCASSTSLLGNTFLEILRYG